MGIVKEFKEFAMKGNVMDLAVGVIIGGAFGKIVSSLVADVIMPPLGAILGGVNFTDIRLPIRAAVEEAGKIVEPAVTLNLGNFLQASVDFFIIAFAVFLMVKGVNALQRRQTEASAAPAAPTRDQELLMEIRDLLKKG